MNDEIGGKFFFFAKISFLLGYTCIYFLLLFFQYEQVKFAQKKHTHTTKLEKKTIEAHYGKTKKEKRTWLIYFHQLSSENKQRE